MATDGVRTRYTVRRLGWFCWIVERHVEMSAAETHGVSGGFGFNWRVSVVSRFRTFRRAYLDKQHREWLDLYR
jgi:hypothetical protein